MPPYFLSHTQVLTFRKINKDSPRSQIMLQYRICLCPNYYYNLEFRNSVPLKFDFQIDDLLNKPQRVKLVQLEYNELDFI